MCTAKKVFPDSKQIFYAATLKNLHFLAIISIIFCFLLTSFLIKQAGFARL